MNGKGKGGLNAKFFLCAALVLCLISMIGASLIQTQNHKIRIKQMTWETPAGHQISADLWIPENATAQSPAPAIVTIEGWYNNKEMQDLYTLELARRGYVVLTMDLHGHGNSESLPQDQLYEGAVGVDGAVQLIASLPYVDTERIGVTGHSSGGTAANMALPTDNEREKPLIAAILHQAADWQDDTGGDHSGEYGSRSVGIIASEYDDFYSTGEPFWGLTEGERILAIWLFPVIFFLFITAIMTRIVYKKTHNPYLAGFINAMVIVMISCSNTFTSLSAGNLIATTF